MDKFSATVPLDRCFWDTLYKIIPNAQQHQAHFTCSGSRLFNASFNCFPSFHVSLLRPVSTSLGSYSQSNYLTSSLCLTLSSQGSQVEVLEKTTFFDPFSQHISDKDNHRMVTRVNMELILYVSISVMLNCMCQLDRATGGCPGLWPNTILGVSVRVFLDCINIWIGRLIKVDCPL